MAFINNYYIHYYKNLFAHKCYCYAYDDSFHARVNKCACVIKFHVASNSRSNLNSR